MAEVIIVRSEADAGEIVASEIAAVLHAKPDVVLGLATGSTPLSSYRALARRVRDEGLDVSRVSGFALDEYVGLAPGHPQSYRSVIDRDVVQPLGLSAERVHVPDNNPERLALAGAEYEAALDASGGVDIQILGIGRTGHIGFNEPGSSLASLTRVKALAESTRRDNSRFFESIQDVPTHCITQGIGTILRARHLILLAFGESKAQAIAAAVEGPVTASQPGSAVQLHPRTTVIVDEAAASLLAHADYYRHAWAHRLAVGG